MSVRDLFPNPLRIPGESPAPATSFAAGIVRSQKDKLDLEYIEHWVQELGLEAQWEKAKAG